MVDLQSIVEAIKGWQTLIAGVVGFGGLAWVTYKNADNLRKEKQRSMESQIVATAIEVAHLNKELQTARRLFEAGGDQVPVGRGRLKAVNKSVIFDYALDKSLYLPMDFLSAVLDYLFSKRDVVQRYGERTDEDVDRTIAAILAVEALVEPVVQAARKHVKDFDLDINSL